MKLQVELDDTKEFTGGWSMDQIPVLSALRAVTFVDKLSILEFGTGKSTELLAKLLRDKSVDYRYVSYENDPTFVCPDSSIETIFWEVFPAQIVDGIFDLIINDGPNGVRRKLWYELHRKNVRPGTVLLLDGFYHYVEFLEALDLNYTYEILSDHVAKRGTCWRVVKVLSVR